MDVDAVVTAKRKYHEELTHLKVHPIENDTAQQPEAKRKYEVLRDILKDKKMYYTGNLNDDNLTLQSEIRVVKRDHMAYLRTDDEDTAEDFFPELPIF